MGLNLQVFGLPVGLTIVHTIHCKLFNYYMSEMGYLGIPVHLFPHQPPVKLGRDKTMYCRELWG